MDFSASTDMPDERYERIILPRPNKIGSPRPPPLHTPHYIPPIINKSTRSQNSNGVALSYFRPPEAEIRRNQFIYQPKISKFLQQERITIEIPDYEMGKQQVEVSKLFFLQNANMFSFKREDQGDQSWDISREKPQISNFSDDSITSFDRRRLRDIKFTRRELIPQTKASNLNRITTPSATFGIRGHIKSIYKRKPTKSIS